MTELGHTHRGHGHVHGHQNVIPTTVTPQTSAPAKAAKKHKAAAIQDTITSAGTTSSAGTTNIGLNDKPLFYTGAPILASPNIHGMSSADMMMLVGNALDKHKDRQIQQSVKIDPANIPDLKENIDKTTTTTTTTDNQGKQHTTTTTTITKTLSVENNTLGAIANTLTEEIFQDVRKHFKGKHIPLTLNQVQAFVQQALTSGALLSIMPALDLLRVNTHPPSFETDPKIAGVATAGSFAQIISQSGPAIDTFASQLFPNDPAAASAVANAGKDALTNLALNQLGTSLGLPALGTQVHAQASLVRNESNVLHTGSFRNVVLGYTNSIQQATGLSKADVQRRITNALDQVTSKGELNTRQEILAALRDAFKTAFPGQLQLTNDLAAKVERSALDSALSSSGNVYAVQFDPTKINVSTVSDSIKNAILKEFADSEAQIHALTNAANAIHAIKQDLLHGQLKSEQAVRDDIQAQLVEAGFSSKDASRIAANTDLGLPVPEPLTNLSSTAVLTPDAFQTTLHSALLSRNIDPDSDLGRSIETLIRGADNPKSTDMIGLINQGHKTEEKREINPLNLSAAVQGIKQEENFLNPAMQVVLAFSGIMNGTPDRENNTRKGNQAV